MPLYKRLPKRGFNNIFGKDMSTVTLERLQAAVDSKKLDAKKPVSEQVLLEAKIVRRRGDGIKLLATGELKTKLDIQLTAATKSAQKAVEKAGGKFSAIQGKKEEKKSSKAKAK